MYSIIGRWSGWNKLTQRFGTDVEPQGTKFKLQTIKVSAVRWRMCVTIILSPQGMYLRLATGPASLLGRLPAVIIPWSEFKKPRKGRLYLDWKAVEMSVGEPEIVPITFRSTIYQKIMDYLDPTTAREYR
ncbi:MAG TPA: hypothetical protein VF318_04430 [Dehalococcoidales bacterium]